jgi:hypothetical protein
MFINWPVYICFYLSEERIADTVLQSSIVSFVLHRRSLRFLGLLVATISLSKLSWPCSVFL